MNYSQSILQGVRVGGYRADNTNIQFTNITAPAGFSINADGTINMPSTSVPGEYVFTYDLCPISGAVGCVTGIKFQLSIDTTVRANPDVFYYGTSGTYYGSLHSGSINISGTDNILINDGYAADCGYSAPNSFVPVVLFGSNKNITNLNINQPSLFGNFNINNNGKIFVTSPNGQVSMGTYPFTYSFCDFLNPSVCSNSYGWISVISDSSKMVSNNDLQNEFETIKIYPNPTNNIANITFSKKVNLLKIQIYNLLGQKISEKSKNEVNETILDLNDLSNGSYMIIIDCDNKLTSKLIIKN